MQPFIVRRVLGAILPFVILGACLWVTQNNSPKVAANPIEYESFTFDSVVSDSILVPPVIVSIDPLSPQTSTTDQNLVVNGTNFVSGLTVTIILPNGGSGTLSGSQIQNVTSTSFTARVTLNGSGSWCIRVNNPNGEVSNFFCFTVVAGQTPVITSISPPTPPVGNADQNLVVSGSNFQSGLTVTIFFPNGGSTILSGTQIQGVTPTSFTLVVTLNVVGNYGIRVNNPSGLQSATFNFMTQSVTPTISSITPAVPCVNNTNQAVIINGSNFFIGLTITVTFPNGGSSTLGGSQIPTVNSSSITMLITLADPGNYMLRINNPGGVQSTPFPFTPQNCLNVSAINPLSPIRRNVDQDIVVSGSGFAAGLTVVVNFPNGGTATLSGSQILNVSATSFLMRITVNGPGTWLFKVRNPNGDLSNIRSFYVREPGAFDFDGDAMTDLSIFRPNGAVGSEWWWLRSSNATNGALQFGAATDRLAPVDFTGDGKTDIAFWRPSTGQWFVLRSEDFSYYAFPLGTNGDVPVPADYDGDGKGDAAVYRESFFTWYILKSSGVTEIIAFGAAGDKPVNADYDGDGKADIAIFRPSGPNGAQWWVRRSSNSSVFALQFGSATDKAVPGDFTGDGKADVAFWRPATGFWNVLRSEDFSYYAFPFGTTGDVAVPGDYDGDGMLDAAVFRPSSSTWFANKSGGGILIQQFGIAGDVPVPSAFVR